MEAEAKRNHRRTVLVSGFVVLVVAFGLLRIRRASAAADRAYRAASQLAEMERDAHLIQLLEVAPKSSVDRARPNDQLISQVRAAMGIAAIPAAAWKQNDPKQPVRARGSPYLNAGMRVVLEGVSLKQTVALLHSLVAADPTLWVDRLQLTPHSHTNADWDVDVTLSYAIYAPSEN